jgi:hypothetical protein
MSLTIGNLQSFEGRANCPATLSIIHAAYDNFWVSHGNLEVLIADKMRPVLDNNIKLELVNGRHFVTIDYGNPFPASFFVGAHEARLIDAVLVWMADPNGAHKYGSYNQKCLCTCGYH